MVSAPHADRVWKNMTRSITVGNDAGPPPHPSRAGTAAYTTLLRGSAEPTDERGDIRPWLLLRERTTERSRQSTL
ncbi:hypothetical protein [Streptomyces sp. A012304]|uniref:hypothetical protein n=1 Tax=Streptomyces sp. A012304 TaxID=375446 RepID=UPI00223179C4|nr:hypothetical protein [Streptomyces sp. A012304]GKQ39438.1 hypothetical protein ALMP_59650 [Streptomyces sp. A012304]